MRERNTRQREVIRRAIEEAGRPLSPREIHDLARRGMPAIGIATVYRELKRLLSEGWLVPVELPGEATRFEQSGKSHHHHFCCRKCGRIYELEGCALKASRLVPEGFVVEGHEVVLYGVCGNCGMKDER
ncbi:transcriptional repressor [bacterium]|nr:transcriptional repressor [bacterium]